MSEMQDATVTVSNLGDRGSDTIQSIIFPPQVAYNWYRKAAHCALGNR
ncbi:2-oxo acid dehydrogenase subunit E2 [uncultured Paraglaciecola sp.]|nr:2-oxo acid dehydrogenase subunit E2 [uncultured Paraglaciecola sp.]